MTASIARSHRLTQPNQLHQRPLAFVETKDFAPTIEDGVRFAETQRERDEVYALRYAIYVCEMDRLGEQADHSRRQLHDPHDRNARSIISVREGRAVATLRIRWGRDAPFDAETRRLYALDRFSSVIRDEQICIIERLMVPAQLRGEPRLTMALYEFVFRFLRENGIELIVVDCELHLINCWLRLGFRPFAAPITYEGVGMVVPLAGIVWDVDHLKRVGSPLLMSLRASRAEASRNGLARRLLGTMPGGIRRIVQRHALRRLRIPEAGQHADVVRGLRQCIPKVAPIISEVTDGASQVVGEISTALEPGRSKTPTIFDAMTEAERHEIVRNAHIVECGEGQLLTKQGNPARTLFVLLAGEASVRREDVDHTVARLRPGAVFGEVSYFLDVPRTADIVATSRSVKVLGLHEGALARLLDSNKTLATKLMLNVCRCMSMRFVSVPTPRQPTRINHRLRGIS